MTIIIICEYPRNRVNTPIGFCKCPGKKPLLPNKKIITYGYLQGSLVCTKCWKDIFGILYQGDQFFTQTYPYIRFQL